MIHRQLEPGQTAIGGFNQMSGHYPFRELTKHFSPERRARIDALVAEALAAMEPAQTSESPQKPARPAAPAEGAAGP